MTGLQGYISLAFTAQINSTTTTMTTMKVVVAAAKMTTSNNNNKTNNNINQWKSSMSYSAFNSSVSPSFAQKTTTTLIRALSSTLTIGVTMLTSYTLVWLCLLAILWCYYAY